MKDFVSSFRAFALGLFALAIVAIPLAHSQSFVLPSGTVSQGMIQQAGKPPVGTGCTIAAGSTDMAGSCTASSTSGSIAFGKTYNSAPFCTVVDASATPVAVYTVTTTQITLTTITSTHVLRWRCDAQSNG